MSYSPKEHVEDCKAAVRAAQLVAKHYPDARQSDVGDNWRWCHASALKNATHFDIDVVERNGRREVIIYPYHEIEEDGVIAQVYASEYDRPSAFGFVNRVNQQPELHAAIMALLKGPR